MECAQRLRLLGAALVVREQIVQPHVQHPLQQGGTHVARMQAQPRQCHAVGTHDPAVGRHGHDALGHAANALGRAVQMQADVAFAGGGQQAVFDHARCGADQAQRVGVAVAVVARDVEDAQQLARGRQDGRGRAGEKAVALQVVLAAMHLHRASLGQGRADGVGAPVGLVPGGTAGQRHALGLVHKVGVAQRVHEHAAPVGQHHHTLAVSHLLEQVFHHRTRMREQLGVAGQHLAQRAAARVVNRRWAPGGRQARRHAA
ncbi:hypothetical protein D3C71_1511020 [compost metagenome]